MNPILHHLRPPSHSELVHANFSSAKLSLVQYYFITAVVFCRDVSEYNHRKLRTFFRSHTILNFQIYQIQYFKITLYSIMYSLKCQHVLGHLLVAFFASSVWSEHRQLSLRGLEENDLVRNTNCSIIDGVMYIVWCILCYQFLFRSLLSLFFSLLSLCGYDFHFLR